MIKLYSNSLLAYFPPNMDLASSTTSLVWIAKLSVVSPGLIVGGFWYQVIKKSFVNFKIVSKPSNGDFILKKFAVL